MIGAKTIVNSLIKYNIKTVFGVSGGAILPVLNEFYRNKQINFIQSRTELGGSFMAEGYAKATKTPGVVMVTSGPGAINTMTSMQNALSDGTPILALTGQVSTHVLGTDAFQEADIIGISKPCTKWNYIIKDGSVINSVIDQAFLHMLDKRHGPVLIDLPKNIMSVDTIQKNIKIKKSKHKKISSITSENILKMINESKKPVILCGQGVFQADAVELLRKFALLTSIPVTTTLMGLGVFPEKNINALKMLGMHGSYYANMAIQNCDLLLNFGSRFDDRIIGDPTKFAQNAKIVHVDIENKNINKVIKTQYYINNDCKHILEELLDMCDSSYNPYMYYSWYNQINEWKKIKFSYPSKKVVQGRQVISQLNNIIQNDTENNYTIVADVGAHQMWAAQFIDYNYPKVKWLTSGGLGSMGYALPASIGVKIGLSYDNEKVICICGDGGFTMSFVEILTAIENKVNVKILIINNSYQLMVKMWQEKFYNNQLIGVKMNNPPFEEVCKSMGCDSIKIDINNSEEFINEKLKYVLYYNHGPIVCNIITDENECVLPMVSPGKALDDMIIDEDNNNIKYTGDAPC